MYTPISFAPCPLTGIVWPVVTVRIDDVTMEIFSPDLNYLRTRSSAVVVTRGLTLIK